MLVVKVNYVAWSFPDLEVIHTYLTFPDEQIVWRRWLWQARSLSCSVQETKNEPKK